MDRLAGTKAQREHVTLCIEEHRDEFIHRCLENESDLSHLRWTLDTHEDYRLISLIYEYLYEPDRIFSFRDAARLCGQKPELMEIVAHVRQKPPDQAG
jgi:spore coat polysaccharide biosynthesis protein SpsF